MATGKAVPSQSKMAGPEEVDPYGDLPDGHTQGDLGLSSSTQPQPPPYTASEPTASGPSSVASGLQGPEQSAYITRMEAMSMPTSVSGYGGSSSDVHITSYNSRAIKDKSLTTAYFLAICMGFLGAHHFYLGRPRFGVLYAVTMGLFGLGWMTDLCRLPMLVRKTNSRRKDPATYFQGPEDRDVFYVYIMWLPFGFVGAHHYYLRRWKWAVLYTFTAGLFGIGWIIDAFRIPALTRDTNHKLALDRSNTMTRGPALRKLSSAYLLWIPPLGFLGGHHYYLKQKRFGILYTLTGGLFFLGWIADGIRMKWLVDKLNKQTETDFQRASDGQVVTRDKTKYLDDAYVLHCNIFGFLGAAQFYLGRYGWAVGYLFTMGFFGIGWIVDIFRMRTHVKEANDKKKVNDQVRIQYGPNQIILVTDGRVVAGSDPGVAAPVVIPALPASLPTQSQDPTDQPPSYDSVVAEAGGASGGSDVHEHRPSNLQTVNEKQNIDSSEAVVPTHGAPNPAYHASMSQEGYSGAEQLPEKKGFPPHDPSQH